MTRSCNSQDTAALSVAEACQFPYYVLVLVLYADTAADCKVCKQVGNAHNGPARVSATSTQCDCSHLRRTYHSLIEALEESDVLPVIGSHSRLEATSRCCRHASTAAAVWRSRRLDHLARQHSTVHEGERSLARQKALPYNIAKPSCWHQDSDGSAQEPGSRRILGHIPLNYPHSRSNGRRACLIASSAVWGHYS